MKRLGTILVLLCACTTIHAEAPAYAIHDYDSREFVVAGVLRKASEKIVIKLVQSVETARTPQEALGQFTQKIQREYSDYSLWDTLVTPLPRSACEKFI